MNAPPIPRLALTAMEAPAAVGVSDDFFREHVAGDLAWVRKGRKKLVAISELERWLRENSARTIPTPETRKPDLGRAQSLRDDRHDKPTA